MNTTKSKAISLVCNIQGWALMAAFWFAVFFVEDATVEQRVSVCALMIIALLSFAVSIYADGGRRYE